MTRDADSPAAPVCQVCGAPVRSRSGCDFDRPADDSPALGDYAAMHRGLMTHAEHLLVVARWFMHNPRMQGPTVMQRYRPVVLEAWGKPQALFPLEP
jgi:hypothetical protein